MTQQLSFKSVKVGPWRLTVQPNSQLMKRWCRLTVICANWTHHHHSVRGHHIWHARLRSKQVGARLSEPYQVLKGGLFDATATTVVCVLPQLSSNSELSRTDVTLERPIIGVSESMVDPALPQRVLAAAVVAVISFLHSRVVCMCRPSVWRQSPWPRERLTARRTHMRAHLTVNAWMLSKLAGLRKPLRTLVACKRFLSRMDALMLNQLTTNNEPATYWPFNLICSWLWKVKAQH